MNNKFFLSFCLLFLLNVFLLSKPQLVFAQACTPLTQSDCIQQALLTPPAANVTPYPIGCKVGPVTSDNYCCATQSDCSAIAFPTALPSQAPNYPQCSIQLKDGNGTVLVPLTTDHHFDNIDLWQFPISVSQYMSSSTNPFPDQTFRAVLYNAGVPMRDLGGSLASTSQPFVNSYTFAFTQSALQDFPNGQIKIEYLDRNTNQWVSPCDPVSFSGQPSPTPQGGPTAVPTGVSQNAPTPTPSPDSQVVDSLFLWAVNPLTVLGNSNPLENVVAGFLNMSRFGSPAKFLNELLPLLFSLGGMILFIMIVWGGFEMLYGANDTKAQEAGKQRITAALIGFLLLFLSYWIAQILQAIFGVNILG